MISTCRLFGAFVFAILSVSFVSGQEVVWSDEFNGDEIDKDTWIYDVGGHGFGNGQLEFNTDRPENSYLEDGNLVIEVRRESYQGNSFTSARMMTQGRFAFQYGSLEARIKLPNTADGLWPAFWMLGNNFPAINWPFCGEIDILEIGGKEGIATGLQGRKINCALHFANANETRDLKVKWHDATVDLHRDFHLYRVDWTPEYLKFFLDGDEFASFDITSEHLREFHQPYFPILNVAVGSWATTYTGIETPDQVTATLPAKMCVDWIRLTANDHTKVILGKDLQAQGRFGVFSEDSELQSSLKFIDGLDANHAYADDASVYLWNNMTESEVSHPASEGKECWTFDVEAGDWFGMGVFVPNHRNMSNYANGHLHFDIRSNTTDEIRVGIKSSRGGESYLPLGDQNSDIGFERDGKWHSVKIPLDQFENIDFATVHQFFMITGDAPSTDFELSIDNVWWEPSP